jgi:hypothetical protein
MTTSARNKDRNASSKARQQYNMVDAFVWPALVIKIINDDSMRV